MLNIFEIKMNFLCQAGEINFPNKFVFRYFINDQNNLKFEYKISIKLEFKFFR